NPSALGNIRQVLYNDMIKPAMGLFLDMLNNRCQARTPTEPNVCRSGLPSQPNENYAREILQLFSIEAVLFNQDGSQQLDRSGNPIATYDQTTVKEFTRVFTVWAI